MRDDQAAAILERRARALARPMERADHAPGESLVTFTRGARYALPVSAIREVRPYTPPQPLPRAPSFVTGLAAVRGGVVPAVDLAIFLGTPTTVEPGSLLVVADGTVEVALLVEVVDAAATPPEATLGRLPAGTPRLTRAYAVGLAPGGGVVLDATRLLRGIASALRSRDLGHRGRAIVTPDEGDAT